MEGGFLVQDYFGSGPGDVMNGDPKSDCRRMEGKFPYEPRDISEVM